ncbi:type III-A CRISPR-associated protein Cas10/Csm1 [Chloroflexia bacterium SDU3-3]|nr:type III-A CRISPR-associated protein Cas10/Csm1 [Chloroflexia bacterium SDU3-3]
MADSADPMGAACEVLRYWATYAGQPPDPVPSPTIFAELTRRKAVEPRLTSIFSQLPKDAGEEKKLTYVRPAPLTVSGETIFPTTEPNDPTAQRQRLNQAAASIIAASPEPQQLTALADLLEREAWCLPSPLPGIPLYDFARVHAALAAARAHGGATLLVGGDVSGVQDFIYTIPAKGAAKQLRGRSLYLQLLSEAIARYIIGELGMPEVCLLYCGGGRFYAVLPNKQEKLDEMKTRIAQVLLERHGVAPYLALGWQPLAGDYSKLWEKLHEQINQAKQRKFADLETETLQNLLFTPREQHQPQPDLGEAETDAFGRSIAEMGGKVGQALYLRDWKINRYEHPEMQRVPTHWHHVLNAFRSGLRTESQEQLKQRTPDDRPSRLRAMRDLTPEEEEVARNKLGQSGTLGRRYTVNEVPLVTAIDLAQTHDEQAYIPGDEPREGEPKPFGMLAEQSQGIKRLGVLRMDVDDLGALFGGREKAERSIADLAETAALSAALGRFFEGYVGTLCRNINSAISRKEEPDGGIYTVYSGGDDLFIVGSWHLLPDLAYTIRQEFARYVTGKTSEGGAYIESTITLSAGITLHTSKFPIYQAADMAHEALEAAKAFTRPAQKGEKKGRPKDALTFLGITIGWEDYAELQQRQRQLYDLVQQGAPTALLITLQSLAQQARPKRFNRDGRPQASHGPWMWRGAYMLTRLAERVGKREGGEKSRKEIEDLIHYIRHPLKEHSANQPIILAGMAARWAQLLLRGEDKR